ncbi:MAG: guanylate kinase [Lachnospiraceae bacterium]|nr:guanylate kinase [Lachnospiraceae bacterium]
MGKIFYMMGKSSSGKDTIYKRLIEDPTLGLMRMIMYTTRPIRTGETDGVEYHFVDEATLYRLADEGKVIEERTYPTRLGLWHYFTVDDGQVDLTRRSFAAMGTLESYIQLRNYFGKEVVFPIYIEVDDGIRLKRAVERELKEKEPHYSEVCRRFLADEEDFSEENLKKAGIKRRFNNETLEETVEEVKRYCMERLR